MARAAGAPLGLVALLAATPVAGWQRASPGYGLHVRPRRPAGVSMGPDLSGESDVVVVGAGIGGLSCAAMLAKYGYKVTVAEAHDRPGGSAHAFSRRVPGAGTFTFDSGPSLFSGCSSPSANPLRQVLDAVGEAPEWRTYDAWRMYIPEGTFDVRSGDEAAFRREMARLGGDQAASDWARLLEANAPLADLIAAVPPIALRGDLGAALTAGVPYAGKVDPVGALRMLLGGISPSGPFSAVLARAGVRQSSLVYRFFDFLAFALSGLPASDTSAAAVSFMIRELFEPGAVMDYPVGGSQAIADTLVRAVEKRGGRVLLKARAKQVRVEGGRCTGVWLADGSLLEAKLAVVLNMPTWDAAKLVPEDDPAARRALKPGSALDSSAPATPSFMHLHLGFRSDGLPPPEDLGIHHIAIRSWEEKLDARDNAVFVSVPSTLDPEAAPAGYHTLHAYLPATEPFEPWAGLQRSSPEYAQRKEERSQALWAGVEAFIPDIRERVVYQSVGSPLTHARYLNTHRGTYGPALRAGSEAFPGPQTALPGLWCCGASTFPGIGVPAVAGSGMGVANSLAPVADHLALLDEMRANKVLR